MTRILADSSSDYRLEDGVCHGLAPLTISTDEKSFVDNDAIDTHEMLDYLAGYHGRSYTACPATGDWLDAMGDTDGDEIYIVTMTSGLSGTYNSAVTASEMYKEKHPSSKVAIFDTLSTGPEMRLIIEKLQELCSLQLDFEIISQKLREYMQHTRLFFSFVSLHNFAQNGRVSKVVASAVGILGISILGTASEDGKVEPSDKVRGENKVISKILNMLEEAGYTGGRFRICHVENPELAKKVVAAVQERFHTTDAEIYPAKGLCSYYAERYGIIMGCEC